MNELTVRCEVSLVVGIFLIRALNVCGILLVVRLKNGTVFVDGGQVETRTTCSDCVGSDSVVNRILYGLNSFRTP